ncbi:MAG: DNA mismatch endonuclease Vsr [Muribaculaceae bacterium]|nr:DNA mismatch endonuclease Vsr [Muribaculaceae bacterium]
MADTMTPLQRHHCMSSIHSRDTRPELVVRRCLWRHGFRYRLCDKTLPGRPDIVLRKWNTVIFVNGCFWHGHDCGAFRLPRTNSDFWRAKIARNRQRDSASAARLQRLGFNVITVWECELKPAVMHKTLESLVVTLSRIVLEQTSTAPTLESSYGAPTTSAAIAAEPIEPYGTK